MISQFTHLKMLEEKLILMQSNQQNLKDLDCELDQKESEIGKKNLQKIFNYKKPDLQCFRI